MAAGPTYSVNDDFSDKDKSLRALYDQLLSTLRQCFIIALPVQSALQSQSKMTQSGYRS